MEYTENDIQDQTPPKKDKVFIILRGTKRESILQLFKTSTLGLEIIDENTVDEDDLEPSRMSEEHLDESQKERRRMRSFVRKVSKGKKIIILDMPNIKLKDFNEYIKHATLFDYNYSVLEIPTKEHPEGWEPYGEEKNGSFFSFLLKKTK